MNPSDKDRAEAIKLVNDWPRDRGSILTTPDGDWLRNAIATALASARAAPAEGFIRTSDGVDRKVLGTLPLTVEGDVIGDNAYCWFIMPGAMGKDDDRPARVMYKPMPIVDPDAYGGTRRVHSTRESALSSPQREKK